MNSNDTTPALKQPSSLSRCAVARSGDRKTTPQGLCGVPQSATFTTCHFAPLHSSKGLLELAFRHGARQVQKLFRPAIFSIRYGHLFDLVTHQGRERTNAYDHARGWIAGNELRDQALSRSRWLYDQTGPLIDVKFSQHLPLPWKQGVSMNTYL
jgi:hypothetical protein